jgi:hypothetical protein
VIDEASGQEGVKQRLDRGRGTGRVEHLAAQELDHVLVGELFEPAGAPQWR